MVIYGAQLSNKKAKLELLIKRLSLRLDPPQIDQILPFFPNSENRDFLGKKYRGLGVWSNLEIGELVR